ncbi:Rhs core protein with extension [Escherichia coli]|uniref:Rhs core protein with extension n=1 Tax=Escherichia coli TaxID=562 RepID=A0A376P145_ECOLX|nr:Rhs core protein with extension [Escherichia coli]
MLGRLERELRAGAVSAESEAWLAQCGLTAEQMAAQLEAEYIPERNFIFTTVTTGDCRWRSSAGRGNGVEGDMTNGETWAKPARSTSSSHSVCRGSSMMRSRGCTTTATVL